MSKKKGHLDNKTEVDLKSSLAVKKESLRSLRFGSAGSKSTNVKAARTLRREIAQLMTRLADGSKRAGLATK